MRLELGRRSAAAQMTATWNAPDHKFNSVCFYIGYQARSSLPSTFDCDLSYTLGNTAGALAAEQIGARLEAVSFRMLPSHSREE